MKQLSRSIDARSGVGTVKLEPSDAEDLWHIYNLLFVGDHLRSSTVRKVQSETTTGSSSAERVRLTLTLKVSSFDFDAREPAIRVAGQVVVENPHVRIGAFHTLSLEPHRAFSITKEAWDSIHLSRLDSALDPAVDADVAAVVMQEGLAHVLLVSRSLTLTRARVETAIPRKGANALFNRSSALERFFHDVFVAITTHLDLARLKVLLVASPGFVKNEFIKFANLAAAREDCRSWINNRGKIVLTHASSGHKHAFSEVLARPELQGRLSDTKAMAEVQALANFHDMLTKEPDRAVYGPAHVKFASDMGAIDTLLVTDTLFRAADLETRKKYVALVEAVKAGGGKVHAFSTQHGTGEQLDLMSGVAAVLRFPLAELDDLEPTDAI